MKKKLTAICLSALMLTSFTSVNCMAENPYPDEESYGESSFAILQDILRENDCQAGIAFLGYIVSSMKFLKKRFAETSINLKKKGWLPKVTVVQS